MEDRLVIHSRGGKNVAVAHGGHEAEWCGTAAYRSHTTIFSSRPLRPDEIFTTRLEGNWRENYCFLGLTSVDPTALDSLLHIKKLYMGYSEHKTWLWNTEGLIYNKLSGIDAHRTLFLNPGDIIGVSWTSSGIKFYYNGEKIVHWESDKSDTESAPWEKGSPPTTVWAVLQMGNIDKAVVLSSFPSDSQMNEACAWSNFDKIQSLLDTENPFDTIDSYGRSPIDWLITGMLQPLTVDYVFKLLLKRDQPLSHSLIMNKLSGWFKAWPDSKEVTETANYANVFYIITKYICPDQAGFSLKMSIFSRLCVCRAGMDDIMLLDTIVERMLESILFEGKHVSKQEDGEVRYQDVVRPVGGCRIYHILSHIRPLYFHNESMFTERLEDRSDEPGLWALKSLLTRSLNSVPRLTIFCTAVIRHCLWNHQKEHSVLKIIEKTQELPKAVKSMVTMDTLFGGHSTLSNFQSSYDFVCGVRVGADDDDNEAAKAEPTNNFVVKSTKFDASLDKTKNTPAHIIHIRNVFDFPNVHDTVLKALFPLCNKCINVANIDRTSTDNPIVDISQAVSMSSHSDFHLPSHMYEIVQALMHQIFDRGEVSIVQCGSTSLGLKISDWGEFDFQVQVPIAIGCTEGFEFSLRAFPPKLIYYGKNIIFRDPKHFLFCHVNNIIGALKQPDNPHTGTVYIEQCYPHSKAPGICVTLAWYCNEKHKHVISFDITLTMVINKQLAKVKAQAAKFKDTLPKDITDMVLKQHFIFICPTGEAHFLLASESVELDPTYTACDKVIFKELFNMAEGTKHAITALKFIRDAFFPKILKPSERKSEEVWTCKHGEVLSSYTIQQAVLWEFIAHPTEGEWRTDHLNARVISVLEALQRPLLVYLYTGKAQPVLSVPPKDVARIERWLRRDINLVIESLKWAHEMHDNLGMESFQRRYRVSPAASAEDCAIYVIAAAEETLYPAAASKVFTEPQIFSKKLGIPVGHYIYYYNDPAIYQTSNNLPLVLQLAKRHQVFRFT